MNRLKTSFKTLTTASFWIDAGLVIVGHKASDLAGGLLGGLPTPAMLKPYVGPVAVITLASIVGGKYGRSIKIGAFTNAASTILGMVGIGGLAAE